MSVNINLLFSKTQWLWSKHRYKERAILHPMRHSSTLIGISMFNFNVYLQISAGDRVNSNKMWLSMASVECKGYVSVKA